MMMTTDADSVLNDAAAVPREPAAKRKRAAAKPVQALSLRVIAGFHAGAGRALARRDVIMIGQAADCDVILADEGVGRHHCIVTRGTAQIAVRAVDSPVMVDGVQVAPGEPIAIQPQARIAIGDAVLTIAPTGDPEESLPWSAPAAAAEAAAVVMERWRAVPWWATLSAAGLVLVLGAWWWSSFANVDDDAAALAPVPLVREVVNELGLKELDVSAKPDGQPLVKGVVPDQNSAAALKTVLQSEAPEAVVQVRLGDAIAEDVSEILRLNDIDAQARYLGDGRVEVRGHLGDERALSAAIQSRAMRDIQGLKKVTAINLDGAAAPAADRTGPSAKRVTVVVAGPDPYVVTADGSRYYVGAQLPGGERLAAVEGNEILLEREGSVERKPGVGTWLAPGAVQ